MLFYSDLQPVGNVGSKIDPGKFLHLLLDHLVNNTCNDRILVLRPWPLYALL